VTVLHETDIDGVRCFWVDAGRPTLAALLLFRCGSADEPVAEAGWQHLLEHMALEGRTYPNMTFNGQVGLLETSFHAHGVADEVVEFLGQVTGWLARPDLQGIGKEARVLQSELNGRGPNASASVLTMRYGAQGPGVAGLGEPGVGRATPDLLAARAERVFTRGNAVLVLDGPPPPTLRLRLPAGDLVPIQPAVPVEDDLPAAYVSDVGLVVSGAVPRSTSMVVAHDMLRRRLSERLRSERGAAYSPWSTYEPVDAEYAVIIGGSDVHPDYVEPVGDLTLMVARGLGRGYPEAEEVESLKAAYLRNLRDPYLQVQVAAGAAHEVLHGRPPVTLEERIAKTEAIRAEEVREGWQAFSDTLLLGLPGETRWHGQLPLLRFPVTAATKGAKSYRSVDWPANKTRLAVADGVVEVIADGDANRVQVNDLAAMFTYEDRRRYLLRRDGYGFLVRADRWRGGDTAIARIDAMVPDTLRLPQTGGAPEAPRLKTSRKWWSWLTAFLRPFTRTFDWYTAGIIAMLLLGVVGSILAVLRGDSGQLVYAILATVTVVRLLIYFQDESKSPPRR